MLTFEYDARILQSGLIQSLLATAPIEKKCGRMILQYSKAALAGLCGSLCCITEGCTTTGCSALYILNYMQMAAEVLCRRLRYLVEAA